MLHLGGEEMVPLGDVLAIIDLPARGPINAEFFHGAAEEGFVHHVSADEAKSAILTESGGQIRVYYSPISSLTLVKRASVSYACAAHLPRISRLRTPRAPRPSYI